MQLASGSVTGHQQVFVSAGVINSQHYPRAKDGTNHFFHYWRHDEPLHHTCFDVQIQSDNKCLDDLSMNILQPVDSQGPLGTFVAGRMLHYTHYKYKYGYSIKMCSIFYPTWDNHPSG